MLRKGSLQAGNLGALPGGSGRPLKSREGSPGGEKSLSKSVVAGTHGAPRGGHAGVPPGKAGKKVRMGELRGLALSRWQRRDSNWGLWAFPASGCSWEGLLGLFSELPGDGAGRVIQVCSVVDTAS